MRLCFALVLAACSSGAPPEAPVPGDAGAPPALTSVTADREDLLFRYHADGADKTAQSIEEIPEAARVSVHVIDLAQSPAQRRAATFVQVFDLRQPGPDGRYRGEFVPRAELEARLAKAAEAARPKQQKVTMYSASWCGVCTKARKFLTDKGVPFVERDVDRDPAAKKRLTDKGLGGSVPVFEIGGDSSRASTPAP